MFPDENFTLKHTGPGKYSTMLQTSLNWYKSICTAWYGRNSYAENYFVWTDVFWHILYTASLVLD